VAAAQASAAVLPRLPKTTLEIYAQVQKRVSRKNVHAAFGRLLTGADSAGIIGPL
jgi:hypothetical protein